MRRAERLAAVIAVAALAACEPYTSFNLADVVPPTKGQVGGSLGGAAIGALAAHAINASATATGTGAAIGLLVGLAAGTWADPPARQKVAEASLRAAEQAAIGEPVEWNTELSSGQVTPLGAAYADHGRTCRALRQEQVVDGEHGVRDITACRRADDLWELVAMGDDG
jgi:surface antigen